MFAVRLISKRKHLGTESVNSVKPTVENPRGSVEKLSPKESPKDANTILRCGALKDSVSIQGTSWGDSFFLPALRIFHSAPGYHNPSA